MDATTCWNKRGFGRFSSELLNAMVRWHPEHTYILTVDRQPSPGELPDGCELIDVKPRRTVTSSAVAGGRRSLRDMLAFTRAVARMAPDVFFYPAVYSFFPVPRGIRSVVCLHDTIAEDYPQLVFPGRAARWAWGAKMRLALWQATRIMTISQASRRSIEGHFSVDPARIDVVTEGPSERFRIVEERGAVEATLKRLELPRDRPYLLFVGGISPHKNLGTLLDAVQRVVGRRALTLVLVGDPQADGFQSEGPRLLQRLAQDEALGRSCRFTGYVSDEDLVHLYNGAHALVLPSFAEGFGLPAVEAMASGIPVLASRAGSLPEVVGDAGLFFDPLDAEELAERITTLLDDSKLHAELSERACRQVRRFTWRRAADLAVESLVKAAG